MLDLDRDGGARARIHHAVCLEPRQVEADAGAEGAGEGASRELAALARLVAPGGLIMIPGTTPQWRLLEQLARAGLRDPAALSYWSRYDGYLGREYFLHIARAGGS